MDKGNTFVILATMIIFWNLIKFYMTIKILRIYVVGGKALNYIIDVEERIIVY